MVIRGDTSPYDLMNAVNAFQQKQMGSTHERTPKSMGNCGATEKTRACKEDTVNLGSKLLHSEQDL